jgi:hypothetical protein
MTLNSRVYDTLKWLVIIVLPGFTTFYGTIGDIWNWSSVSEVVLTLTALTTFLGVVLGISRAAYLNSNKDVAGTIVKTEGEDVINYSLELNDDVSAVTPGDRLTFKVR